MISIIIYIQQTLQMLKPEVSKEAVAAKAAFLCSIRVTEASHPTPQHDNQKNKQPNFDY